METYEKKYKEANDKVAARFGSNIAKEIFTDLYESEDEKVRKTLIDYFNTYTGDYYGELKRDSILAWLENVPYTIDHEKREGFRLGYKAGLEKQGEQKVSEHDIVKTIKERIIDHFDNHLIIDKCFSIGGLKNDILRIVNEVNQGEQKSAWSEEDELNLKQAIYVCHQNGYTAVENWLKSLKGKVQQYSDIEKQEMFIRSLRPHFWRPSVEQMKALKYVAYHLMPDSNYRKEMFSLYEDLKKLKA